MTDRPPSPLTPADLDLHEYPSMLLDVVRIRDSDLIAHPNAEVVRYSLLSWCISWHQTPAGSLPDDDDILARLLGHGRDVKGWKKMRAAGVLHGWIRCSDGRLYHPIVAEKAVEAMQAMMKQKNRTEAARQAKRQKMSQSGNGAPTEDVTDPVTGEVTTVATEYVTSSVTETVTSSKEGRKEGRKKESEDSFQGSKNLRGTSLDVGGGPADPAPAPGKPVVIAGGRS
jgi:hypothetical protein